MGGTWLSTITTLALPSLKPLLIIPPHLRLSPTTIIKNFHPKFCTYFVFSPCVLHVLPMSFFNHLNNNRWKVQSGSSSLCNFHHPLVTSSVYLKHKVWEGVPKSFRTGRLERKLQMVQLPATRCSCIAILWVSLVSFAAITLWRGQQRVTAKVSVYFVMTQSGNFWIHPRTVEDGALWFWQGTQCITKITADRRCFVVRRTSVTYKTGRNVRSLPECVESYTITSGFQNESPWQEPSRPRQNKCVLTSRNNPCHMNIITDSLLRILHRWSETFSNVCKLIGSISSPGIYLR
jgi:hypothetical protein